MSLPSGSVVAGIAARPCPVHICDVFAQVVPDPGLVAALLAGEPYSVVSAVDVVVSVLHVTRLGPAHGEFEPILVSQGVLSSSEPLVLLLSLAAALVPSDTACLASSPGRGSLTAVWTSLEVAVDLLL